MVAVTWVAEAEAASMVVAEVAGFTAAVVVAVSMVGAEAFTQVEASAVARSRHQRQVMVRHGPLLPRLSVRVAAPLRGRGMVASPGRATPMLVARRDLETARELPQAETGGILLRLLPVGVDLRLDRRPARSPRVAETILGLAARCEVFPGRDATFGKAPRRET